MKKYLLLLAAFLIVNSAFAADYDSKAQLATKRQIYKVQVKTLNNSLKTTMDEYSSVMVDEKLNTTEKQKKMKCLEEKIMKINAQKLELKEQYILDKKEIKEKNIIFSLSDTHAADVIPSLENGMILKCVATRDSGTYYEYKNGNTDFYEYKNGKIYSQNLSKMFGNPNYKRKVLKLNISDDMITFKDRLYRWGASHYKWVTIDRKTGEYLYDAKKQYNWAWYFQKAEGHGTCSIIK